MLPGHPNILTCQLVKMLDSGPAARTNEQVVLQGVQLPARFAIIRPINTIQWQRSLPSRDL